MSRSQRIKGKEGELEVVHTLISAGFQARRSGDAGQIDGDISLDAPLYLEVRRREATRVIPWVSEVLAEELAAARNNARPRRLPIVVFRTSKNPWMASLGWDHLLGIFTALDERGILDDVVAEAMANG